jgi:hypothetical protein
MNQPTSTAPPPSVRVYLRPPSTSHERSRLAWAPPRDARHGPHRLGDSAALERLTRPLPRSRTTFVSRS